MVPSLGVVEDEDVIEDHVAQGQDKCLACVPDLQHRMKAFPCQDAPFVTVLVAEIDQVFGQDVPEESELEALVQVVGRNHHVFTLMENDSLASDSVRPDLENGEQEARYRCQTHQEQYYLRSFRAAGKRHSDDDQNCSRHEYVQHAAEPYPVDLVSP